MSVRKKSRSKYDQYFNRSTTFAECILCKKMLKFSQSSGPNNLKFHLKTAHTEEWEKMEGEKANGKNSKIRNREATIDLHSSIPMFPVDNNNCYEAPQDPHLHNISSKSEYIENTPSTSQQDNFNSETIEIETAIMEMVASDGLPISLVEKSGFLRLMKMVAPKLKMRNRAYYTDSLLPNLESRLRMIIQKELSGISKISITLNGWTSKDEKPSLIKVTGHWLDLVTFSPKQAVIGCSAVDRRPISNDFERVLMESLYRFGIPLESVTCIVEDSFPEELADRLNIPKFHCYGHNLQQCVKEALLNIPAVNSIIQKMKEYIKASNITNNSFLELQTEDNFLGRMMEKESELPWSILFLMVQSFLKNKLAISFLKIDHPGLNLPEISPDDWNNINALYDVLEPISETTKSIECTFGAPASVVIPSIRVLQFKLENMKTNTTDKMKNEFIESLLKCLLERTSKYEESSFLKTTTFIDPRFKDSYFEDSHKNHIISLLYDASDTKPLINNKISLFDQFLNRTKSEPMTNQFTIEKEVDEYLRIPPCTTTNPYDYWRIQNTFPNLQKLAIEYLSIPSFTSESKKLSSISEIVCSQRKSNLSAEKLDQLIFCNMNLSIFGFENNI